MHTFVFACKRTSPPKGKVKRVQSPTVYSVNLKCRMSKQNFIEILNRKRSIYNDPDQAEMIASLLDTVSSDIYSESQRFVFELIQNADDAAKDTNNAVHFDFLPNCLIVSHNGKPFDENDIISLTGAGASTKRADPTKTGYKGIGFKSVFGKSERVTILSDGYQFRFDKSVHKTKLPWQIIPIWTEPKDLSKEIQDTILKSKFAVSTVIEVRNVDSLLNDLNELLSNGQILLFLRRISKISVSQNGKSITSIEKKIFSQDVAFNEVTLSKDGKEISSWLTKTFEKIPISAETKEALQQDDKMPEKLKEAEFTEISFAAKIEEGKLKQLKKEESLIFTYLPTKCNKFDFPFLVNGSFLTTAAREDLHEDRVWNQWLFNLVAEKIVDWLQILASSKFKFHILHLLPQKFGNSLNELKISFDNSLDKSGKEKAFVPSKALKLKKPSELIVDKTGLSELDFISSETLIDFINQQGKTKFGKDAFVHSKMQRVERLKFFGAFFFEPENLEGFFLSDVFKSNHDTSENFKLINYFHQIDKSDETKLWHEKLKAIPFIYGKGKILRAPSQICFPYKSANVSDDNKKPTVIHPDVITSIDSNPEIKDWLRILGVSEFSDIAYLEVEIIPQLDTIIEKRNYKELTRYIFELHKKNELTQEHYQSLSGLKLLCKDNSFHNAGDCFLSDFYIPALRLEKLYHDCNYVDVSYKEVYDETTEWKLFFIKIGVSETISIRRLERLNSQQLISSFQCDRSFFSEYSSAAGYNYSFFAYSLTKISFIEKAVDYKFSKLFWEALLSSNVEMEQLKQETRGFWGLGGMSGSTQGDRLPSYTEWLLGKIPLIPTTTKKCLLPENVFLNTKEIQKIAGNYLPVFDNDENLSDNWKSILHFKEHLELSDYLTILELISQKTEEDEILRKNNQKRIGDIYNKIAFLLKDFSDDKKEAIKDWAVNNKLLSSNGKFENASELKWIKIKGFTTASEKLKVIQLPENCNINSTAFEELISLFQVQIIDKFVPTFKKERKDFELKKKLQNILPYFVSVIERKQYTDFSKEFERLFSIVTKSEFFTATEIKLSFKHQGEIIEGASLNVFHEDNNLYFKGRWRSPITMFSLIPELSSLLELTGLNDELRLLLELDEAEIIEWLSGLGYDISIIKSKPEYQTAKRPIKIETPAKVITTVATEVVEVAEPETDYEQEELTEITSSDSFEPEVTADIDIANLKPKRRKLASTNSVEQLQYQEITDDEVRVAIGRWSEKFVFNNLDKWGFTEIIWENEIEESGKPYDFKAIEKGKEKFIEVKGTPSSKKDLVYLSSSEWNLMTQQNDNYILIRVYNAGKSNVSPVIIENPSQQIEQGSIQVALRV